MATEREKMYAVYKWRDKRINRRCIYCFWCEHIGDWRVYQYKCTAKRKVMTGTTAHGLHRPFCKLFLLDKEDAQDENA